MRHLAILGLALLLVGCKGGKGGPCVYNGDCGDGQACIDERCADVSCTSSADCEIHQYCGRDFECADGCRSSDDCRAGEFCGQESHQCYAYGCRDTQLDCDYGEVCDTTTGECYDDPEPHCESCNLTSGGGSCGSGNQCLPWDQEGSCDAANGNAGCPSGTACYVTEVGGTCSRDQDCDSGWTCDVLDNNGDGWPDGSYCHQDHCYSGRCLVGCDAGSADPCPRGYQCGAIYVDDPTTFCYAECSWMEDNGYL